MSHRGNSCNYTPQPLPSSPRLPQHQYPLCPNILLTPFSLPPSRSSCHLKARCAPRLFVLCFTAVNVTWVTLSLLSTDGSLFATLLKRPLLTFHVFSFLLRARERFSSRFTQPCDNTLFLGMPECASMHHGFVLLHFCLWLWRALIVVCFSVNTLNSYCRF